MNSPRCAAALSLVGLLLLPGGDPLGQQRDRYRNFAQLARHEREGRDFQIRTEARDSSVVVLGIHAGRLEAWTSSLVLELAGSHWSYYLFEALGRSNNQRLHLTSHHFDEARCVSLLRANRLCVSIHGYEQPWTTRPRVCVGGGNHRLRDLVSRHLRARMPELATVGSCRDYPGQEPSNVVNQCREQGVQLELSRPLRRLLHDSAAARSRFRAAIHAAVADYEPGPVGAETLTQMSQ